MTRKADLSRLAGYASMRPRICENRNPRHQNHVYVQMTKCPCNPRAEWIHPKRKFSKEVDAHQAAWLLVRDAILLDHFQVSQ